MTLWKNFARLSLIVLFAGSVSTVASALGWDSDLYWNSYSYEEEQELPTIGEPAVILVDSYGSYGSPFRKRKKRKRPFLRPLTAKRVISPSAAYQAALVSAPGSQGLGVRYLQALRGYVVRLRSGGRVYRVFVDGRTGRVMRR